MHFLFKHHFRKKLRFEQAFVNWLHHTVERFVYRANGIGNEHFNRELNGSANPVAAASIAMDKMRVASDLLRN